MNRGTFRYWRTPALMMIITAVVASTAIRVEWYNHAVGGFLPRPQPPSMEGNDVKWRTTGADMAEKAYRVSLAMERGLEPTDEVIATLDLSSAEQQELSETRRQARLNAKFRGLIETMGLIQYLLVPIGLLLSIAACRVSTRWLKITGFACLAVNLAAGGLMFYRQYFQSLGW